MLKEGYLEQWDVKPWPSVTPQGGIASPSHKTGNSTVCIDLTRELEGYLHKNRGGTLFTPSCEPFGGSENVREYGQDLMKREEPTAINGRNQSFGAPPS